MEFIRDIGACFSVNNMLRAECFKAADGKGPVLPGVQLYAMQSYDFYYLFQHYAAICSSAATTSGPTCWGGTELIRRKLGKDAHAMTIALLTDSQGHKMGKTAATPCGWTRTKPLPMSSINTGET